MAWKDAFIAERLRFLAQSSGQPGAPKRSDKGLLDRILLHLERAKLLIKDVLVSYENSSAERQQSLEEQSRNDTIGGEVKNLEGDGASVITAFYQSLSQLTLDFADGDEGEFGIDCSKFGQAVQDILDRDIPLLAKYIPNYALRGIVGALGLVMFEMIDARDPVNPIQMTESLFTGEQYTGI